MKQDRLISVAFVLVCLAVVAGCGGGSYAPAETPEATTSADDTTHAAAPVVATHIEGSHSVRCGCSLEDVGYCGNWVDLEGQFVELEIPEEFGLGEMPFCGQDDLMAKVEGEMNDDGKFLVTAFEYVE